MGKKSFAERRKPEVPLEESKEYKTATESFDEEFKRYAHSVYSNPRTANAVALARNELSRYRAILWQDKKLKQYHRSKLTPEKRQYYEERVKALEKALNNFHEDISSAKIKTAVYCASALIFILALWALAPWKYNSLPW